MYLSELKKNRIEVDLNSACCGLKILEMTSLRNPRGFHSADSSILKATASRQKQLNQKGCSF